jgi:hypothetical protein
MRRNSLYLVAIGVLCGLMACRLDTLLHSGSQEEAFRERYVGRSFYTAMVLRPYTHQEGYLVDLSGRIAEEEPETPRAPFTVPLGTPITLTGIDRTLILARVNGYTEPFRVLVVTEQGTLDEVAQALAPLLIEESPLPTVRPDMRPFVARQQITQGMSRREVYMSWGQPDKKQVLPSSTTVLEEWLYFDRRIHLYLEDGLVRNWVEM